MELKKLLRSLTLFNHNHRERRADFIEPSNPPCDDFLEFVHCIGFNSGDDVIDTLDRKRFVYTLDLLELFQNV